MVSLEKGRKRIREDRSQFIRTAIRERLVALGFDIPPDEDTVTDRAGDIILTTDTLQLNEKPAVASSKATGSSRRSRQAAGSKH